MTPPGQSEIEAALERRAAFLAAIPRELLDVEDLLPEFVNALNASTRSKLHRVYMVADDISRVRAPFVACKKGCSSCCHMNVSVTRSEADRIAKTVGTSAAILDAALHHDPGEFAGVPCPFLDERGACSVYADRPLACRKHSSFFADENPCHPSLMNYIAVPMVSFSGLDNALMAASGASGALIADIRDFFPAWARR